MNLLELMEKTDPKYIEEADESVPKKNHRAVYPIALAACACIVILAAIPIIGRERVTPVEEPPVESVSPSAEPAEEKPAAEEPAVSDEYISSAGPLIADTSILDWGAPADGERVALSDIRLQQGGGGEVYGKYGMSYDDIFRGVKEGELLNGETLPVFKATYPVTPMLRDPELITDEVRDRVRLELDAFIALTGLPAEPSIMDMTFCNAADPYADLDPIAINTVEGCRIRSFLGSFAVNGITVDISQENWLETALSENAVLRTALEVCGITEPHITWEYNYPFFYYDFDNRGDHYPDVDENYFSVDVTITQDSDSYRDYMEESVFSSISISYFVYEGESETGLYVFFNKPTDYTCCGEYEVVTYDEAAARFIEETGLSESDIVGCRVKYVCYESLAGVMSENYYAPVYIFYYVSPYQGDWNSGTDYAAYTISAVRD